MKRVTWIVVSIVCLCFVFSAIVITQTGTRVLAQDSLGQGVVVRSEQDCSGVTFSEVETQTDVIINVYNALNQGYCVRSSVPWVANTWSQDGTWLQMTFRGYDEGLVTVVQGNCLTGNICRSYAWKKGDGVPPPGYRIFIPYMARSK